MLFQLAKVTKQNQKELLPQLVKDMAERFTATGIKPQVDG